MKINPQRGLRSTHQIKEIKATVVATKTTTNDQKVFCVLWTITICCSHSSLKYTHLFGLWLETSENLSWNVQHAIPFGLYSTAFPRLLLTHLPLALSWRGQWKAKGVKAPHSQRHLSPPFRSRSWGTRAFPTRCSPLRDAPHSAGEPQWLAQPDGLCLRAFWQGWLTGLHFLKYKNLR